jgi:hypothetical protein
MEQRRRYQQPLFGERAGADALLDGPELTIVRERHALRPAR